MGYLVFARKWRPMLFKDVVGQEHATRTLENAISSDRIAHAYLFSGTRGVGKTTTARIFAKALNCEKGPASEPCNECESCTGITAGRSLDVLEIDGASNRGIDEIRDLREMVRYSASGGRYKIYIIDEVHMLTNEAFNALLKTLEEPPEKVLFIFATTEPNKVPATILSRCQRFDFRPIATDRIRETLGRLAKEEGASVDEDALWLLAHKADGSLRDGLSLLDQAIAFSGNEVTGDGVVGMLGLVNRDILFNVTGHILDRRLDLAVETVNTLIDRGYDWGSFLDGLLEHLRNVLLVYSAREGTVPSGVPENDVTRYREQAGRTAQADLLKMLQIVMEASYTIKRSTQPRFLLEIMMARLVELESSLRVETLLGRLESLQNGIPAASAPAAAPVAAPAASAAPVPSIPRSVSAAPAAPAPRTAGPVGPAPPPLMQEKAPAAGTPPDDVPPAADTPRADLGPLTADTIGAYWKQVIIAVKNKKKMLGFMLTEGQLADFRGNEIVLAFNRQNQIHVDMIRKQKGIIEHEIKAVTGTALKLAFTLNDNVAPQPTPEKKTEITNGIDPERIFGADGMTGEIAQVFDGEIIPPRQ